MSTSKGRVDWSFGPGHGPVAGAVNAAGSALSLTMVADLANASPLWGLTGGVVAAGGAVLASLYQDAPRRALVYRGLSWLCAGSWSTWALATGVGEPFTGPWSINGLAALAVGTIGAASVGWASARADDRKEAERQQQVAVLVAQVRDQDGVPGPAARDQIAALWQEELRRQSKRDVTVVGVEFWEPNTGFTLDVELPADGTTIEDVKPYEKTLAHAMGVPLGCAVEVLDPGVARRVIHVRVGTVDAMKEDHHLPEGCEPGSIENDLSIGIHSDRKQATVNIRYNNLVLIGQVDSGKSNQLNVITRQIVRCTDALVWAIDLTGSGRNPRPWVRAWKDGRAEAPAIDWIAPTEDEARLMGLAAQEIIKWRTADYEEEMARNNWDKIMVSPSVPEIVIVTDEFGALPADVKEMLQQISDTGRGAGVRVVSCALEATGTYIPRGMISQARERIGMRVQDETQLQYLFDTTWRSGRFDMSTMRVRGSGLVSSDAAPTEKFKGWRIDPKRIDAESIAVAPWRPELDELSLARCDALTVTVKNRDGYREQRQMSRVYTDRWNRTLPVIFPVKAAGKPAPQQRTVEGGDTKVLTRVESPAEAADGLASSDQSLAEKLGAAQRAAEEAEAAVGRSREDDLPPLPEEPNWDEVESWLAADVPTTDPAGKRKPHPRLRMRQLVWDAGDAGVGPTAVRKALEAEGYATTQQTVNDWMKTDLRDGVLAQERDRAPYTRGPKMTNPHEQD